MTVEQKVASDPPIPIAKQCSALVLFLDDLVAPSESEAPRQPYPFVGATSSNQVPTFYAGARSLLTPPPRGPGSW